MRRPGTEQAVRDGLDGTVTGPFGPVGPRFTSDLALTGKMRTGARLERGDWAAVERPEGRRNGGSDRWRWTRRDFDGRRSMTADGGRRNEGDGGSGGGNRRRCWTVDGGRWTMGGGLRTVIGC